MNKNNNKNYNYKNIRGNPGISSELSTNILRKLQTNINKFKNIVIDP